MPGWVAVGGARGWAAEGTGVVTGEVTKSAGDHLPVVRMDFGNLPELWRDGDTIVSAVVTGTGLTLGTPTIAAGYRVEFSCAGGTAGVDYAVTVAATLASGGVISRTGTLHVV